MTSQEITNAIFYLVPEAEFSFTETDLDTLNWQAKNVEQPTKEAILLAIPLAKAKINLEHNTAQTQKQALLQRLGITADEAALLLS